MIGVTAVIQARLGSTRLPGKVLRPIVGHSMLWHIVQRVKAAKGVSHVVVATSDRPGDVPILEACRADGIDSFAGSELDVLDRFYRAALGAKATYVMRITGDCPLADPDLIGQVIAALSQGDSDYVSVATGAGAAQLERGRFPDGLDVECFSFGTLERAWREATSPLEREHVTPYIWQHTELFRCRQITSSVDYSHLRWTVDNEVDFRLITGIYEALYSPTKHFGMNDVLDLLKRRPDLASLNRDLIGSEGYEAFHGSR